MRKTTRPITINKLTRPLRIAGGTLASRFAGLHRPLFASIEVTHRCNLNCLFCDKSEGSAPQMETEACLRLIDDLARNGTCAVGLDGGEFLLHLGAGRMIKRVKKHGMRVSICTNGTLIKQRIEDIRGADVLKISLDGPEAIHDQGRGNGSFSRAMAGAICAIEAGIPVVLRMTLAKHNVGYWREVLYLSEEIGAEAIFQPAIGSLRDIRLTSGEASAEAETYRRAIDGLIHAKKSGRRVGNDFICLDHLRKWPQPTPMPFCAGGRIEVAIGPEGNLYPCGRWGRLKKAPNVFEEGLMPAFLRLTKPRACTNCWCTLTLAACFMYRPDLRMIGDRLSQWAPLKTIRAI